jgi:hypothetical protein
MRQIKPHHPARNKGGFRWAFLNWQFARGLLALRT